MVNWSEYLESVRLTYAKWWKVYTFTDVVGRRQVEQEALIPLWNFDLQVQTIKPRDEQQKQQEKIEYYSVLEGLRKYKSDHLLLVGKPGSGKSTALLKLLLEEAERPLPQTLPEAEIEELAPHSLALKGAGGLGQIPVLVELRYYETSIIDLIRNFCKRHRLWLENAEIEKLLFQGKFLLLVDGLNELPSEEARQNLQAFRQDHRQTPMIFTTRDLGIGGDLDIGKKLEMQPLTETQMQDFVCAYLPEQGEEMLKQLGTRLQEFGQTPLLLSMLCSVFVQNQNKVPSNLGSVFRLFTKNFNEKPISEDFPLWSSRLLQQLAWVMTQGTTRTDLKVAIPRSEVEEILTEFFQKEKFDRPRDRSLKWLRDLLNHHLIQLGANDQIEFRHQLIQEYYTAEYLLKQLPKLSDDCLKRDYLNYLKWTEPLALMAELIENEVQAVRVVKLALEVDWQLGARLAGEVKSKWHEQTVNLIADLKLPQLLEIRLLGITKSEQAAAGLIKLLEQPDSHVRSRAADALGKIKSQKAITGLIQLLEDPESHVCESAAYALGEIKSEQAIPGLIKLSENTKYYVRSDVVYLLEQIKSEQAISGLIKFLEDQDSVVRRSAASALGRIKSEQAISGLIKFLEDQDSVVRRSAASALGRIKSEQAISGLIKLLEDQDSVVRRIAASALGEIKSEQAIPGLIKLLEDQDSVVRRIAASALGEIKSEQAISGLIKLLEDQDSVVRRIAASALGEIKSEQAIPGLIKLLKDQDFFVRRSATSALGKIKSEQAIPGLIQISEDPGYFAIRSSADALAETQPEQVPGLIELLKDPESDIRLITASILEKIESEQAIPNLIELLEDPEFDIRLIEYALEQVKPEQAIPGLIKLLENTKSDIRRKAAFILGEIESEQVIPDLIELLILDRFVIANNGDTFDIGIEVIKTIQEHFKFYNPLLKNMSLRSQLIDFLLNSSILNTERERQTLLLYFGYDSLMKKITLAGTPLDFTVNLIQVLEMEGRDTLLKFIDNLANSDFLGIENKEKLTRLSADIRAITAENWRSEFIGAQLQLKSEPISIIKPNISTTLINILHLSDLHFSNSQQAQLWSNQLAEDLRHDLNIPHLDALILSGDIANFSTPEEYQAAEEFIVNLSQDLPLKPEQIIIVPGNHDLNWKIAKQAYQLFDREEYESMSENSIKLNEIGSKSLTEAQRKRLEQRQNTLQTQWQLTMDKLTQLRTDYAIQAGTTVKFQLQQEIQSEETQLLQLDAELKQIEQNLSLDTRFSPVKTSSKRELKEGHYIEESATVIRVRDEEKYKQRFANFSNFYQAIKNQPYPLEYRQQYTLDYLPSQNILILGLNSAWQLDHHYKSRASINMDALSNALTDIRRHPEYKNCIKIAVWHHPLDSAWEDRIKDKGFMEQLAVAGFRFFLHGHIHKAETSLYRYDMSQGGRKCVDAKRLVVRHRICAGTFGAPTKELIPAYPWQYNLLQFESDKLTVRTRRREEENGAWKPDARWGQGAGKSSLDLYTIEL
ncbi:HEAT repeat domain-containing protein [Cylindrospermum sp. FACHB-282]|uniref:HEAT repeat domain-containing protein n=1 Tax=Cylindrospermum sp. FACHB-282 TaxID=2692794 RepID=UPI001F555C7D|nr:HEAT repeat domain-containing protein [Cylindrospermum sp. FACHB-282]